jgi:hypothetical protein
MSWWNGYEPPGRRTVYYKFVAPFTGTIYVMLRNYQYENTSFFVFDGTGVTQESDLTSSNRIYYKERMFDGETASLSVTSGTTYYIWLAGTDSLYAPAFDYALFPYWDSTPSAPANDMWANAQQLTLGVPAHGTTMHATSETGEPTTFGQGDTVWYKFTTQTAGSYTVRFENVTNGLNWRIYRF